MKHLGTVRIETDRLILRRFEMEDAEAMYKNWASDAEVTKFLTWLPHRDLSATRAVLRDWTEGYAREDQYSWAIVLKEYGPEPIGSIGVGARNDAVGKAEIGYCIGKSWWHQGIMPEALKAVTAFLMDAVGYGRIEATHDTNNPNSGAVMRKCGMRYEGTLRKASRNNQGICDISYYGILREDRTR